MRKKFNTDTNEDFCPDVFLEGIPAKETKNISLEEYEDKIWGIHEKEITYHTQDGPVTVKNDETA